MRKVVTMLALIALLSGCATSDRVSRENLLLQTPAPPPESARPADPPPSPPVSYWKGEGVEGRARVKIDLSDQKAYFYKGGQLVGVSQISTGREGYRTPTGEFRITQKTRDHRSNLYGNYVDRNGNIVKKDVDVRKHKKPSGSKFRGASMPYFMRFNGGVGMHAGYVPGYPASHGCVRLPSNLARHFYQNVSIGTPVAVVR